MIAVPIIGLRIAPEYRVAYKTAELLAPLLNQLQRTNPTLTFEHNGPWDFTAKTSDGMVISVTPVDIIVRFGYPQEITSKPGQLRTMSGATLSPYSELARRVKDLLRSVLEGMITRDIPLSVTRFGMVASTTMEAEQMPPGLTTLIAHLGKPWNGLRIFEGRLLAEVGKTAEFDDRCHHQLKIDDEQGGALLVLDYQRYFKSNLIFSTSATAMRSAEEWCTVAEEYFERFGAGEIGQWS